MKDKKPNREDLDFWLEEIAFVVGFVYAFDRIRIAHFNDLVSYIKSLKK